MPKKGRKTNKHEDLLKIPLGELLGFSAEAVSGNSSENRENKTELVDNSTINSMNNFELESILNGVIGSYHNPKIIDEKATKPTKIVSFCSESMDFKESTKKDTQTDLNVIKTMKHAPLVRKDTGFAWQTPPLTLAQSQLTSSLDNLSISNVSNEYQADKSVAGQKRKGPPL